MPKDPQLPPGTGTFQVKVTPTNHAPDPTLASHSLDKQYRGTGELTGISGSMRVAIANGKHSYTLDYSIAQAN